MFKPSYRSLSLSIATLALLSIVTLGAAALETDNWPSFRGAEALAVADDDARLPTTWSTTENVAWKTEIEGLGWSSPVIWGDKIFITTVTSDGDIEEPRMGLYFPYGSPEAGEVKAKDGDLKERDVDLHHWRVRTRHGR